MACWLQAGSVAAGWQLHVIFPRFSARMWDLVNTVSASINLCTPDEILNETSEREQKGDRSVLVQLSPRVLFFDRPGTESNGAKRIKARNLIIHDY